MEAVQAVRSGRQFDVVLMDMMMPVMNGVDSTREIRAMGHTELPILAMVRGCFLNVCKIRAAVQINKRCSATDNKRAHGACVFLI